MWGALLLLLSALLALTAGGALAVRAGARDSAAFFVAVLLGAAAQIVLLSELLSLVGWWRPLPLLLGQLMTAAALLRAARGCDLAVLANLRAALARLRPRALLATASREPIAFTVALVCVALVAVELYVAIVVAPNTWDSLTYHLARVVYWMQNGSIMQFENAGLRQATFPVNAEVLQGWTMLISDGDRFAQLIQWFAQLGVVAAVLAVGRDLGYRLRDRALAACLFLAMPVAVAEASSTQNDMVLTFFTTAAMLFLYRSLRGDRGAAVLFGAAAGLAFGTKSNAPMMLAAIGLGALILAGRNWRLFVRPLMLAIVGVLLLGSLNYGQNLIDRGSLLGSDIDQGFRVESPRQIPANAFEIGWIWTTSIPRILPTGAQYEIENFVNSMLYAPFRDFDNQPRPNLTLRPDWLKMNNWSVEDHVAGGLPLLLAMIFLLRALTRPRSRLELAISIAATASFVLFAVTLLSNVWIGRFALAPAALLMPLAARAMRMAVFRAAALVLTLLAFYAMGLQSASKSIILPNSRPMVKLDRIEQMTFRYRDEAALVRDVERLVPPGSRLGIVPNEESVDYLYVGPHFERTLVRLPAGKLDRDIFERYDLDALLIYSPALRDQKLFKPVSRLSERQLILRPDDD